MCGQPVLDAGELDSAAEEPAEGGDAAVGGPAGDDELELVEVGVRIEAEPGARSHAPAPHSNGPGLFAADPHAGETGDALRGHAVLCDGANQHLFQIAHITVHVAAIRLEVDDRVADELPGTVICDIAASTGLVHVDASSRQRLRSREDVRSP